MQSFFTEIQTTLGPLWPVLIFVLILLAGFLVAKIVQGVVAKALKRTTFDDRLSAQFTDEPVNVSTEKIGGSIAFWLVMLLAFIAAFEAVDLGAVNTSLGTFANRIMGFIPNLIGAALLALVAYVVAVVLRVLTVKGLKAVDLDRRVRGATDGGTASPDASGSPSSTPETGLNPGAADPGTPAARRSPSAAQPSLAKTLGDAVFYFVLLLFLPAVLDALQLSGILVPVQELVNEVLAFLPNLLLAGVILVVGVFVARVVRTIVGNLLAATGVDRLSVRIGLDRATGAMTLSGLLALIAYVLVLIPVIVAALNALQVEAITGPASAMLSQFLEAIPKVFVAALLIGIAYVVGRLLASLVTNILAGAGFNRLFRDFGLAPSADALESPAPVSSASEHMTLDMRSPAGIVGILVLVAVMLFAGTEAAHAMGLDALALLIGEFTVLAGRVLLGLIIFGIGLYLSKLAEDAVRTRSTEGAGVLATSARISILVLAGAMALKQMGLADSIINLAFGLTLGSIAVAAALAYGLGGRDIAREHLRELRQRRVGDEATGNPLP